MALGGTIKLTGEKEYRQALTNINTSLREMSSQMQVVTSKYSASDKSISALNKKNEELNKILQTQKNEYNSLKSTYDTMKAKVDQQKTAHTSLEQKLESEKQVLSNLEKTVGTTSKEYQDQEKKVNSLSREVDKSNTSIQQNENALSKMRTALNNSENAIIKTEKELNGMNDELDETGKGAAKVGDGFTVFKGVLSDLTSSAIKSAINGLKKLGAEVINLGKQAISNYADYEQLTGGIETLFKDSYDQVMKYSAEAFKTAGMNANQYMETMTNFSASLINSLGGDTKKAAEIGNMAIIDMSDNVNKMGSSMESVQNAYRGFAKGNFTMLDNLQLGYSGTKEGMQQLLDKANELNAQQGKNTKYSINNLSDIISAIHVVQNEMGITGTTSKEAATTISGSIATMKSAWENLLTSMADSDADAQYYVEQFVESVKTVAKNLTPVVKTVLSNFVEVAEEVLNELYGYDKFNFDGESFVKGVEEAVKKLVDVFSWLIENKELIVGTISAITGAFIITKIIEFVLAVKNLIVFLKGIPMVVTAVTKGLGLLKAAFTFLTGPVGIVIGIITAVTGGLIYLWKTNEGFRNAVINAWNVIKETAVNVFTSIATFFTETIPNAISNLYNSIVNFFTVTIPEAFNNFVSFVGDFVNNVITFFKELPYNIGFLIGEMLGHIIKFGIDAYNWTITEIPKIINKIVNFFKELPSKIWTWLLNTLTKIGTFGVNAFNKAREIGSNVINGIINFIRELPSKIWSIFTNTISKVAQFGTNMANKAKEGARNTFNNVVNGIKELPSNMMNIGKNIVEGLWNGIKNAGTWIKDKVKNFAKGILDGMKSALGIHSPSTLFRDEVGKNIALGLGEGFTDEMRNVSTEMQNSIPTNFDVNGNLRTSNIGNDINNSSSNISLINAFMDALEGMKIEMDDEEMGRFVRKTVSKAIFN